MTSLIAWALAAAALFLGWHTYGWQGLVGAITVIVFWLLLHFNAAMRAMRTVAQRPKGVVDSAVMLHARLHAGMTLIQVLRLTRSLGVKLGDSPETWEWRDEEGSRVTLEMAHGRLRKWMFERPPQTP